MTSSASYEQGTEIVSLLAKLVRQLFVIDADDPAMILPVAQVRVCGVLQEGPKTMSILSRELGISLSAMTQVTDRLEKSGLVERVAEECDRRVKCLQLTGQGAEIMLARKNRRVEKVVEVLNRMPADVCEQILLSLSALFSASAAVNPVNPDARPSLEPTVD